MRYLILTLLAIVIAVFIFLVLAVDDDERWFHDFSKSAKEKAAYLKFDSLQYGVYRWRTNLQTLERELFLAYYIKIYKDGRYVVMRYNTTSESALYYKGNLDNSTRILLDSLPLVHLDTTYFGDQLKIYDGNAFH